MFDNLDQGWPHTLAHRGAPLVVLGPYASSLYASYWNFEKAVYKSLNTDIFPSFMLPPCGPELPCLPYIVADRAMIPKKGTTDMRQVVNHSKAMVLTSHRWPEHSALHTGALNKPPAADTFAQGKRVRGEQESSYNERILHVKPVGPKMEMSKGEPSTPQLWHSTFE